MKRRKIVAALVLVSLLSSSAFVSQSGARDHEQKKGMHKTKEGREHGKKKMDEKLFYKMHLTIKNQDELGLSDKQVDKIKTLKMTTKKTLIMKKAEIEVVALDVKAAMWEENIDVKAVEKLIDKKYDLKKEKAKLLVNTCASFRKILTKDQKAKMKTLKKQSKNKRKQMH